MGRSATASTFPYAAYPAINAEPKLFIYPCTKTLENAVRPCCIEDGSPILNIFLSMGTLSFNLFHCIRYEPEVRDNTTSTRIELNTCAITVAHATPATPILKKITNTKSRTVLTIAEKTRK